ncbi:beta-galactosidase [Dictyobacter vulcani]|uniref:Beta-galactosidase n=1 Tax=Dictyobacter vulcani TaxID=2607529 RepID=A0A5J4KVM5_9CHLR|nr:beta-galactosidase [Dictyobacter vulcani]GER90521.1 beta-galactosidase [Dictyobacter vulcani]
MQQQAHEQGSRRFEACPRLPRSTVFYGGDYNPEQWLSEEDGNAIWQEDLRLMRKAGVNCVSLGVFSWAALQPAEDVFTFEWLDQIFDLLAEQQIFVCLGTGTAAQPAWLSAAYPEILPVNEMGQRQQHGVRLNYCPTSEQFRLHANRLVRLLAERYREHPALLLWHISNEYGPACYCEHCALRFQGWLQQRYGTLAQLNQHWITSVWSHTYTSWEQIQPPVSIGERSMQALQLDYQRFISAMNLESYVSEAAILREVTPHIPVMTNFHGLTRTIDYFSWAPHQDIITWDSYPRHNSTPDMVAFYYDFVRCLKNNQWLLLEQTPNQVQWHAENPLKRPGVMRLQSLQALAHGSNSVMFFQWRQARSGREMYHGAMVSHAGTEQTRTFQEVASLGAEIQRLGASFLETRLPAARVALLMSWPNWWAVENKHTPSRRFHYLEELQRYYRALWQRNIPVDIVSPDHALSQYQLVIAPLFNMISREQGDAIQSYVEQGGTFLTTYFSGMIDQFHRAWLGGFPGPLRRTLGIWVEEFDPLPEGRTNTVVGQHADEDWSETYTCEHWCDVVHLEGARALSVFGQDFYAGQPAITEHQSGKGTALYIATRPDAACLDALIARLQSQLSLTVPLLVPRGIEVTRREGEQLYYFLLNHLEIEQCISLPRPMRDIITDQIHQQEMQLPPRGVAILIPMGTPLN